MKNERLAAVAGCDDLQVLREEYESLGILQALEYSLPEDRPGDLERRKKRLQKWCDRESNSRFVPPPPEQPPTELQRRMRRKRERLCKQLHQYIRLLPDHAAPTALCLSGGGIRSATFSLGVLQGLARKQMLGKFHYLSTVSGGGYIGSWLSSWLSRTGNIGLVMRSLAHPGPSEPEPIRRLRAYSNYLSPVVGLSVDALTLVSTFLRNLLLNWLVLLPLLAALLLLPRIHLSMLYTEAAPSVVIFIGLLAVTLLAITVAYIASDLPGAAPDNPDKQPSNGFYRYCLPPLLIAAVLLSWLGVWLSPRFSDTTKQVHDHYAVFRTQAWMWLVAGAALHGVSACIGGWIWRRNRGIPVRDPADTEAYGLADWFLISVTGAAGGGLLYLATVQVAKWARDSVAYQELYATLSVPALLTVLWLCMVVYAGAARGMTTEDDREWWARASAAMLGASFAWLGAFVLVIYAPRWLLQLPWLDTRAGTTAATGAILGIVTAAIGYWSKNGATIAKQTKGVAAKIGLRLLDLAALVALLALLLGLNFLVSQSLGTSSLIQQERQHFVTDKLNHYRQAVRDAALCADTGGPSSKSRMACERAAAAARSMAAGAASSTAAAKAMTVCRKAAGQPPKDFVRSPAPADPYSEATDPREACEALTKLAAERAHEPTPAGWARLGYEATLHSASGWRLARLPGPGLWWVCLGLLAIAAGAFALIGTNTFSLHAMYGNRLVRAFLGATREGTHQTLDPPRTPHWFTGFDKNDNLPMTALGSTRLFHVVNAALNLVKPAGDRLEWQQRKAASFTMSPLHCGTRRRGYVRTAKYAGRTAGKTAGMTLGAAMAISGAAASPNMGYHSSRLVSLVMAFFNVRLGWWLPNPAPHHDHVWWRKEPRFWSFAQVKEALGWTTDRSEFVYLSDGGHFENLGLYEMVRRRCRRILVVDAACDSDYEYGDLANAIRKIRTDLGVEIRFSGSAWIPTGPAAPESNPSQATAGKTISAPLPTLETPKETRRHFAVGQIVYPPADHGERGTIVYVKPILTGDEPLDVLRYADASARGKSRFPQQPTSDQFFDESQFESYRVLGLHSVEGDDGPFGAAGAWPSAIPSPSTTKDGAIGAPTPAAPDHVEAGRPVAPAAGARPAASRGFLSDLPGAFEGISRGALLATAITVGGVVGVTGTVALKDSTVSLKDTQLTLGDEDRKLMQDYISAANPANVASGLTALTKAMSSQTESIEDLRGHRPQAQNGIDATDAAGTLAGLQRELADLRKALPETLGTELADISGQLASIEEALLGWRPNGAGLINDTGMAQLRAALIDVQKALRAPMLVRIAEPSSVQLDPQQLARLQETLGEIRDALVQIQGQVGQSAPRRNIRAVGEEGRQ